MLALRIFGGAVAVALVVVALLRYRKRAISRLSLIIAALIGTALLAVSGRPSWFNPVFDFLQLRAGAGRRLAGAALVACFILLLLLIRTMSQADVNERSIRLLVESLAVNSFDWTQAEGLPPGERIVVVMPAHNEAPNIGAVIHAMPDRVAGLPVATVVIDDASDDGTGDVARSSGALVSRIPIQRGQGMAQRVGYEIGLKLGARVVVSMDSDGQHVPEEMGLLVKPILEDQADMVQGSRMLGDFEKESHVRHLGVLFFSRLVSLITGTRITDVSSGYRAIRADILRRLVLEQDQFSSSEVLVEGLRQHARIKEVPITIRARASGASKKPRSLRYGWSFTKVIIKTWLR